MSWRLLSKAKPAVQVLARRACRVGRRLEDWLEAVGLESAPARDALALEIPPFPSLLDDVDKIYLDLGDAS